MKHAPGIYRYGSARSKGEGLRIGVSRHVPRGVRREDWAKDGYFDLWLPLLSPSADLVNAYLSDKITWAVFSRRYRSQMKKRECSQIIDLLALMSQQATFCLGCFCEDETRCHRSLLQQLVAERCKVLKPH
ncbi:DUF488 domain-containing protein [Prosthecobacter sp.]|uniref:DUF488 domain-containing protein n=1 Tax=Prosthecobacter sp. TaxID=1965333 RepID=UPI003784363C